MAEGTFRKLEVKLTLLQGLKYLFQVVKVLLQFLTENQNIVEENQDEF